MGPLRAAAGKSPPPPRSCPWHPLGTGPASHKAVGVGGAGIPELSLGCWGDEAGQVVSWPAVGRKAKGGAVGAHRPWQAGRRASGQVPLWAKPGGDDKLGGRQ